MMATHTDADLCLPPGTVAAMDAAAWSEGRDDRESCIGMLVCHGYSVADIGELTPSEFRSRVTVIREGCHG